MEVITSLHDGYRRFRKGKYDQQSKLYAELALGQEPDVMLIGCADSRADPADIFDTSPGELFTVRNVANLVAPCPEKGSLDSLGTALEYAVCHLAVKHIVVMGHGGCGGVGACLAAGQGPANDAFISPWVAQLQPAKEEALASNPEDPQKALEWQGVRQSVRNLESYPFVKEALQQGKLNLHGAWFLVGSGELSWLDSCDGTFGAV
ncbi:MAG: carbonic anhydrase [bacterium]|nr:carbonic anhydrase [bacterium]